MASFRKVAFIFTLICLATMVQGDDEEDPAPTEAPVPDEAVEAVTEAPAPDPAGDKPEEAPPKTETANPDPAPAASETPAAGPAADYKGPTKTDLTTPMEWIDAAIKKHNEYRALHGSGPLVFNKTLAEIAQAYANEIAKTFNFDHSKEAQKAKLGENLYYSKNSEDFKLEPEKPVTSWYDEIKDYDYAKADSKDGSAEILHFTQLVWKATTDIGIAYAKTVDPKGLHTIYVVANYSPRGNFDSFKDNVVPPTDSKVESKTKERTSGSGCRGNHLISGATLALLIAGISSIAYMYYRNV